MSEPGPERAGGERPDGEEELGFVLPKPATMGKARAALVLFAIAAVAGAAFVFGWMPRHRAQAELAAQTTSAERAVPRVEVVAPRAVSSDHALQLPGTIQALEETVIHPRADGYVKKWLVDIGDKVTEGQVLAEIESPELEQQIAQARAEQAKAQAQVTQQKANMELSHTNLSRSSELAREHLVSDSDVDQRKAQASADEANLSAAQANVAAQDANLRRLQQLVAYTRVTAPFAGTIIARTIERGALVSPQSALYRLASTDQVRVLLQVPQDVAPSVRTDTTAQVIIRELGDRAFAGKVARAAGALDPTLRTMATEIRVPNPAAELMPGMYAQVALTLPSPHRVFEVPPTAIYNDAKGVRVAVVEAAGTLAFRPVVIERDTGAAIQISTGLDGSEKVVRLANAAWTEGTQVEAVVAEGAEPGKK